MLKRVLKSKKKKLHMVCKYFYKHYKSLSTREMQMKTILWFLPHHSQFCYHKINDNEQGHGYMKMKDTYSLFMGV